MLSNERHAEHGAAADSLRSPLSFETLGAAMLNTRLITAAALIAALAFGATAETIVTFGPSPAGRALRMIADGLADEQSLAVVIVEAAEKYWAFPLMPRLLEVLGAYSREGDSRASLVKAAFGDAQERAGTDVSRKAIAAAAESLRLRLKSRREQGPIRMGWFRHNPAIPLDVPLTERSQGD